MTRRGFTLIEVLLALTVTAILGVGLTRVLISSSRFVSRQDAMLAARQGARAALNTVAAELRLVGDGGLTAAAADGKSVTVHLPYAFGVTCRHASSQSFVASLLPADSVVYASAAPAGFTWRRPTGTYVNVTGTFTITSSTDAAKCDADSVRIVPGGTLVKVDGYSHSEAPDSLALLTLFQIVTYRFGSSASLSGRMALWRRAGKGTDEEMVAPFGEGAGFGFLVGSAGAATLTLENTPPTDLNTVRGLELRLFAESEWTPPGSEAPQAFPLKTRVMFSNKSR